ncbi:MAG: transposase [Hyphomonas sp.]|nr:transposase [Hyphomonas sp.]MCB9970025.1 transposase [Hyphomonas sp.]
MIRTDCESSGAILNGEQCAVANKEFSDEQIAFALKQAETGAPIGEFCRKMGVA